MKRDSKTEEELTYTTAPADYDWTGFGTREVSIAGTDKTGKVIRCVASPKGGRTEQQRGRYASGLHLVADVAEWDKLVRYNLVELPVDVIASDHGNIWLLDPKTPAAVTWCEEHLPADGPRIGDSYAVEHRYVLDIMQGMTADGLNVKTVA